MWAVGDAGAGSLAQPAADLLASRPMDYLVYLGDVYENGTVKDFADNYEPTFGRFARKTVPTVGNHEFANKASGFDIYWASKRGSAPPRNFTFTASGWQVLVLNSDDPMDTGSAQYRWLRSVLEKTPGRGNCRIAVTHRPRYDAGRHGDGEMVEPAWALLAGRARMMLSGHDHNMQRFAPQRGITQFVSGAAGRSRGTYPVDGQSAGRLVFSHPAWGRPQARDDSSDGVLRLILRRSGRNRSTAGWAFVSAAGRRATLDHGSISCRRGGGTS